MQRLSENEIAAALANMSPSWRREGGELVCERECADFAAAIELVGHIAALAEEADHHPDILVHAYRRVRLTLTTHSAGGLTANDFALAARIDGLA